jgi:hypothetical protein
MKNLIFRRQFLLTSKLIKKDDSWNYESLPLRKQNLNLYYHTDLEVTKIQKEDKTIVLIGYVIDPRNPELSNAEILANLSEHNDLDSFFKQIEYYSGRFAFLICTETEMIMLHDATGLREIYYCFDRGNVYCGSTPNIINAHVKMDFDNDPSMKEFMSSAEYRTSHVWFGNRTPIKNIFHLQPNFYLDLHKNTTIRYWPTEKRSKISLEEGTEFMASLLKGTMIGATNRYKLHQGLTSGYETRLLLSATKDVKHKVKYLVHVLPSQSDADYRIPDKLAKEFELDFERIDFNEVQVDEEFKKIFYNNNIYARETHLKVFYDAYQKKHDETFWATGTFGNQILRIEFPIKKKRISSLDIATHFNYPKYDYAVSSIETWLSEAEPVCKQMDYDLMTLFFWEQFTAKMQNLGASEGDITREEMRPLNCRKLISTYISLKDIHRFRNHPKGYVKIIETLWKDLLDVPLVTYTNSNRYWIRRTARIFGLEFLIYNFYAQVKTWLVYKY